MGEYLILRFDGPMQAWGDVAVDSWRPSRAFPSLSALVGMLGSALGWTYRDASRTTRLQDSLRYAVLEERTPRVIQDFHTADLDRIGLAGWTRWGIERRGGANADGTQVQRKQYLADGSFIVAFTLDVESPASLSDVEAALALPARPLFLGRKGCVPASQILVGRVTATSSYDALTTWASNPALRDPWRGPLDAWCWYGAGEGPEAAEHLTTWDRRNFETDRFAGSRTISRRRMTLAHRLDQQGQPNGS